MVYTSLANKGDTDMFFVLCRFVGLLRLSLSLNNGTMIPVLIIKSKLQTDPQRIGMQFF